jgi:predicted amidohydrolase YtcJ
MKAMGKAEEWRKKRMRIEHNCVGDISGSIAPWKIQAVQEMGILMMHTPTYCMASPLRSLLKSGIKVGISPDGTTNPFIEIMLITSTHAKTEENLTREEAVIAYTLTNAYAEFMDEQKGTLTKGKVADLAVLFQDIFTIPANQLPATQSLLTIIDGKIVYQDKSLLASKSNAATNGKQ